MEIPYVVTPRKDTGLTNSKIAIWLFLASEVMLFGGFFSSYIFLRIDADYPWPERALPVIPGLINTFVLILSSVTVVFAWAALKMRQWLKFQIFMGITLACAAMFMVLKGIEYNVKFHHQALRMPDGAVVEGHLGYEKDAEGKLVLDHHGKRIEENRIYVETSELTFDVIRYHTAWVEEIMHEAGSSSVVLKEPVKMKLQPGANVEPVTVAEAGTKLSVDLLKKLAELHLNARGHNADLRIDALREEWKKQKAAHPGMKDREFASKVNIDPKAIEADMLTEMPTVTFKVDPPAKLEFGPRDVKETPELSTLRDGTVVKGKLLESPMGFHFVDAVDFRHVVLQAKKHNLDVDAAVEQTWVLSKNKDGKDNSPEIKAAWEWHKGEIKKLEEYLLKKYGTDKDGKAKRVPTVTERYRVEWKDFVAKAEGKPRTEREKVVKFKEEIFGPDYDAREASHAFPHLDVPREQVAFASKFAPAWNTYYAIYFTMTGLHGLHVIGGALVLAYYLFFGKKMYLANPEWLANRVEVGGLFWHFVDLIWIFLFPLLYLM